MEWTHRTYFKQFRLSVEQYGEILVAAAFHGEKKGDSQPCYDVEGSAAILRLVLRENGATSELINSCLADRTGTSVRIEVKSKLARTPTGEANVIHCRGKLIGVRGHEAATHLAVLLFDGEGEGIAEEAWLFSARVAESLQRKDTKSQYIPVSAVRQAAANRQKGLIDIRSLINATASKVLDKARAVLTVDQELAIADGPLDGG